MSIPRGINFTGGREHWNQNYPGKKGRIDRIKYPFVGFAAGQANAKSDTLGCATGAYPES